MNVLSTIHVGVIEQSCWHDCIDQRIRDEQVGMLALHVETRMFMSGGGGGGDDDVDGSNYYDEIISVG